MNKGNALKDLLAIKGIMEKHETQFFLLFGTALGAYRDKDFISHDDDVDIGVFGEEKRDDIARAMEKEGFAVDSVATRAITAIRNIETDIDFFVREEDEFVSYARDGTLTPHYCFPAKFSELEKIDFKGEEFYVLSPIEDYLEWVYGDWRDKSNRNHGKDYWQVHPGRVARMLVATGSGDITDYSQYPEVVKIINKLLEEKDEGSSRRHLQYKPTSFRRRLR